MRAVYRWIKNLMTLRSIRIDGPDELPEVPPPPAMPSSACAKCPHPRTELHAVRDRVHLVVLAEQLIEARERADRRR